MTSVGSQVFDARTRGVGEVSAADEAVAKASVATRARRSRIAGLDGDFFMGALRVDAGRAGEGFAGSKPAFVVAVNAVSRAPALLHASSGRPGGACPDPGE